MLFAFGQYVNGQMLYHLFCEKKLNLFIFIVYVLEPVVQTRLAETSVMYFCKFV